MWNRLRPWLDDLASPDPIARQAARLLEVMLIGLIVAATLGLLLMLAFAPRSLFGVMGVAAAGVAAMISIGAVLVLRRGMVRLAAWIVAIGLLTANTIALIPAGLPVNGVLLLTFAAPIALASLLLGRRGLLTISAASICIVGVTAVLEHLSPPLAGFATNARPDSSVIVGTFALMIGVLGLFLDHFGSSLRTAFAELQATNQRLHDELTERQRAEAALRESEELYRLITENTRDLITLLDQEGRCVYASPSCSGILGYAQVELIGTAIADIVHPDDQVAVGEQMARLASSGAAQATFRARHASGTWRWIETFWTATTQGGVPYQVAVGRDITERKRLEAQFLQAQKMESIGRLAGGVAHDFNNLLTAIMSYTELARDGLAPGDPVAADLDEVAGAARRAADLTSQLLAFARKQIIEPQALNLNTLLTDLDRLLRRVIGEDVELELRLAPGLDYVKADPGQIEQVLINMAVNAHDAMPEGGKLLLETGNVELDPDFAEQLMGMEPGAYVLLAISDTGVGMDADTQRQVFEPFFTTKGPGRGSGLGLATCYGIIKQHGGSIALYSEVGLGSTFKIYLPRVAEAPAPAPRLEAPAAVPDGSETILLAEDEAAVRTLASRVLREHGYTVIEAADGAEALRVAQACNGTPIDLLLTDMVRPKMGGGALAMRIQELYPGIRVLFISGYTDSALVQHGELASGPEFMHKPFSPAALARKVRELLDA